MNNQSKRQVLERRIELLKTHLQLRQEPEHEAPTPLSEAALAKAEAALREVEQQKE